MHSPAITIITPCYNEGPVAVEFLRRLVSALQMLPFHCRILVVDDGSTDNTRLLLEQFATGTANIRLNILPLAVNIGHQAAILQGMRHVCNDGSDRYIIMDCDGEDDPSVIGAMIATDAAIVQVNRSGRTEGIMFRAAYNCYKFLFRRITGAQMSFGNFCALKPHVLTEAAEEGFKHLASFLGRKEYTRMYINSAKRARLGGRSKMGPLRWLKHAAYSISEFDNEQFAGATFTLYTSLLTLLVVALRIIIIPWYDNNLGGIEPNVVYGIQRLLQGAPLYDNPSGGRYAIMQYTPLWYHLVAATARITSNSAYHRGLDVHGLYSLARSLALMFNIFTVPVVAALIRKTMAITRLRSLLYALPVIIVLTTHYYTRGDSMHLFLFACGLYYLNDQPSSRQLLHASAAGAFSAACIMTKQSGVLLAGLSIIWYTFFTRSYPRLLMYFASLVFCFAVLLYLFGGDPIACYQNTVLGLKNGIDATFLYRTFLSRFFLDMVPCYALCVIMLLAQRKQTTADSFRFLLTGAVVSWIFAYVTGLKIGSSNNYFTEFLLFTLVLVPAFIQRYGKQRLQWRFCTVSCRVAATIALFVLLTSKATGLLSAVCIERSFRNDKAEYDRELVLYRYFKQRLHIQPHDRIFFTERMFLDNLFVEYSVMPVKDVITQAWFADSTTFDYSRFKNGMNTGGITFIVTGERRDDINVCSDSLPFVLFDKTKFTQVANVSGYCIYRYHN